MKNIYLHSLSKKLDEYNFEKKSLLERQKQIEKKKFAKEHSESIVIRSNSL